MVPARYAAVALVLATMPACAQYNSGIRGTVTDPAGAVVPRATVTVRSSATGLTTNATTGPSGAFDVPRLAPGDYTLQVRAPGFSIFSSHPTLLTEQTLDVPVQLLVGSDTQSITVESAAPLLSTADSRLQTTLPQNQIDALPVQGRSVIGLANLAPGVTGTGLATTSGVPDNFNVETTNQANANGRGFDGNLYIIDGLDITSSVRPGVVNTAPNADSVQEVAVQTNTYSVEYGRATSIQTAITTKSGANRLHGLASYYYTGNKLWARNEFTPVAGYAPFHYNNFSATVGGPIYRDHTFFFVSTQLLRSLSTTSGLTTFESPEFVAFAQSKFRSSIGTSLLTKYPVSHATVTGVSKTAQQVFGTSCGTAATYNIPCTLPVINSGTYSLSLPQRHAVLRPCRSELQARTHLRQLLQLRAQHAHRLRPLRDGRNNLQTSRSFQVNETHTFGASLLNEAKFGYLPIEGLSAETGPFNIPYINITGQGTPIGVPQPHLDFVQHNYHWRDVASLVKGRHNLRIGFEGFHGDELTLFGQVQSQPVFTFNNLLDLSHDAPFSETGVYYTPPRARRPSSASASPAPPTASSRRTSGSPRPASHSTSASASTTTATLTPPPPSAPSSATSSSAPAPPSPSRSRTAASRSPTRSTTPPPRPSVLASASLGIPPAGISTSCAAASVSITSGSPMASSPCPSAPTRPPSPIPPSSPPRASLPSSPSAPAPPTPFNFPIPAVPAGVPDSHGAYSGFPTANIGGTDPNLTTPLILNYTASVERELGNHITVGANYAGSFGHNLPEGDINTISPNNDINRISGSYIVNKNKLVRPLTSFGAINYTRNGNQSHYNAFIATVNGRFGSRDTFQASYTRSSAIDYGTQYPDVLAARSLYQGPASFDTPNHFSLSESLRLPTFNATNGNPILNGVTNGWVISGSVILQSGTPFTAYTSATFQPVQDANGNVTGLKTGSGDYNGDGKNYDFPNVPTSAYSQPHDRHFYLTGLLPASSFGIPTLGTEGNELRNRYRGPGYANTDLSVLKSFPVFEQSHLEFRSDFFNIFNRPNLTTFQSDLSNGNFGKATSAFNARYIQLAARLTF